MGLHADHNDAHSLSKSYNYNMMTAYEEESELNRQIQILRKAMVKNGTNDSLKSISTTSLTKVIKIRRNKPKALHDNPDTSNIHSSHVTLNTVVNNIFYSTPAFPTYSRIKSNPSANEVSQTISETSSPIAEKITDEKIKSSSSMFSPFSFSMSLTSTLPSSFLNSFPSTESFSPTYSSFFSINFPSRSENTCTQSTGNKEITSPSDTSTSEDFSMFEIYKSEEIVEPRFSQANILSKKENINPKLTTIHED